MADTFTVKDSSGKALATDTASPVVIGGLKPNTTYSGWTATKNDATDVLAVADQVTLASKPTVTATETDSGARVQVKLVDGDGPTALSKVTVQYKAGTDEWTSTQADIATMTAEITGLANDTEYQVQAYVTNSRGDSEASDAITVTPKAAEPSNTVGSAKVGTAKAG